MSKSTEPKTTYHVTYDIVGKYDGVRHREETINAASIKSLCTYLRIKNKRLGYVRNVSATAASFVSA